MLGLNKKGPFDALRDMAKEYPEIFTGAATIMLMCGTAAYLTDKKPEALIAGGAAVSLFSIRVWAGCQDPSSKPPEKPPGL